MPIFSDLAACQSGEFSPTGLANCEACPINTYQSLPRQTNCDNCPGSTVTLAAGSKSVNDCGSKYPLELGSRFIETFQCDFSKKTRKRWSNFWGQSRKKYQIDMLSYSFSQTATDQCCIKSCITYHHLTRRKFKHMGKPFLFAPRGLSSSSNFCLFVVLFSALCRRYIF